MNELIINNLCCIEPVAGFTPVIGHLVKMMNYVRWKTLRYAKELSIEELDFQFSETSNSIGGLLAHISAVEKWFQVYTFEDRILSDEEMGSNKPAFDLGESGREKIKGNPLGYYIDELNKSRSYTFSEFAKRNDEWLFTEKVFPSNVKENFYFCWFHVFEDELNHLGQIKLILKMQNKI